MTVAFHLTRVVEVHAQSNAGTEFDQVGYLEKGTLIIVRELEVHILDGCKTLTMPYRAKQEDGTWINVQVPIATLGDRFKFYVAAWSKYATTTDGDARAAAIQLFIQSTLYGGAPENEVRM